jgi:acyl carrier protein phosphodiesterase
MNLLAHFYLSQKNEDLLTGNFIADEVKGQYRHKFSAEIAAGIELHRYIDSYTDSHPVFLQSSRRLCKRFGHYGSVIADVFYDHLLAKEWDIYHTETLEDFAIWVYRALVKNLSIMPKGSQYMLPYMIEHNWLVRYRSLNGIERSLKGISERATFENNIQRSIDELRENKAPYEKEFNEFFPQLISAVEQFLHIKKVQL